MTPTKVHLLYLAYCPLLKETQANLKIVSFQSDSSISWKELELSDPNLPKKWKNFPSPTVLINGKPTDGKSPIPAAIGPCRREQAPSVEEISSALER
ncbi:MAG: hypothetical protein COB53_01435 [Elusimicrobia bacterium]|nr:MAG: hypothetical protein COB53_01435 [Elusimicrobiota bacterium]